MRILLNARPAHGAYTGVGCYVWNLLDQLGRRPEVEQLGAFTGWSVVPWADFAAAAANEGGELRAGSPLRQFTRALVPPLRRAGMHLRAAAFRRAAGRGGWSLYHEPNYIPLPFAGPTVITVHDLSYLRTPEFLPRDRIGWLRENLRAATRRAGRIIVDSNFMREELLEYFPEIGPDRVRVTHLGVDARFIAAGAAGAPGGATGPPDRLIEDLGLPPRYVLFVGTLEPRKNLQGLLRAHALLPEHLQHEFPLVITGGRGWRQRYFWKELQRLRLRGTVRTLGYVPHALVPPLMRAATLLVYPSHYEGFGLCPLQAAACGTAVLASDIPPLRETLHDAALFADPRSPEAIAHGLRLLIEDDSLRALVAQRGHARAAQFTWERCADRTLEVYRELLG
ncbi:MAG: glycosyltransferase family 4 protein [Candidatus Krumholzibacteriia bacterium]